MSFIERTYAWFPLEECVIYRQCGMWFRATERDLADDTRIPNDLDDLPAVLELLAREVLGEAGA